MFPDQSHALDRRDVQQHLAAIQQRLAVLGLLPVDRPADMGRAIGRLREDAIVGVEGLSRPQQLDRSSSCHPRAGVRSVRLGQRAEDGACGCGTPGLTGRCRNPRWRRPQPADRLRSHGIAAVALAVARVAEGLGDACDGLFVTSALRTSSRVSGIGFPQRARPTAKGKGQPGGPQRSTHQMTLRSAEDGGLAEHHARLCGGDAGCQIDAVRAAET